MRKPVPRERVLFEPWRPPQDCNGNPLTDVTHVAAIKALQSGSATADQQQRALDFIIRIVCGTYEEPFCPGEDGRRSTDYALGKRRVGTYLVSLLNSDIKQFKADNRPTEQP